MAAWIDQLRPRGKGGGMRQPFSDASDRRPATPVTATVRLEELDLGDVATAGRKAANLGALARGRFPVPPGVVVPIAAADGLLEGAVAEAVSVLGDGP